MKPFHLIWGLLFILSAIEAPDLPAAKGLPSGSDKETTGLPDLLVETLVAEPAAVKAGQELQIVFSIRNSGRATARDFRVEFLLDDQTLVSLEINVLQPMYSFRSRIPSGPLHGVGEHRLKIRIDPDNRVAESNEKNNQKTAECSITAQVVEMNGELEKEGDWQSYLMPGQDSEVKITLSGPQGCDFSLEVFRGEAMVQDKRVAAAGFQGSKKEVTFKADKETYTILIQSIKGTGKFTVWVEFK